jgi:hypothetical protein
MSRRKQIQILKKAMSEQYCGETRFDFLDKEEVEMIVNAMNEYCELKTKQLNDKCKQLEEELFDLNYNMQMNDNN